jgi:Na+/melibiose symporter-like transporter
MKMVVRLTRIYKRYKLCEWACFAASIMSAALPGVAEAIKVAKVLNTSEAKWGLAGYAVIIICIAGIIIWRSLGKKFAHKLPWALSAAVWTWAITGAIFALKGIIDNALLITFMFAIGATVAFVLSCLSDLFKTLAAHAKEDLQIAKIKE